MSMVQKMSYWKKVMLKMKQCIIIEVMVNKIGEFENGVDFEGWRLGMLFFQQSAILNE